MTKAKKITLIISLIFIIIGIVIYAIFGFNYDLSYGAGKRISIEMKDNYDLGDYQKIANEIYGNAKVEAISNFHDAVSIKVKDTTDEQLDNLATKINGKYGYEYTRDDLNVTTLTKIEVLDILDQAIIPMITATLIIALYMIVRYRKNSIFKVCLDSILPEVISVLLVLAIFVVFRIPVNSILLPIVLVAFALSEIYTIYQYEK